MADADEASTLRLLLSTDNHLGYAEKDPVRGNDSFRTFQEILRLAQSETVDLLLLAGDLFHDAKPSRKTMYQTMSLLRSYCMGDGAVRFQIVSDQSINFPNFGVVNYEDPNYNIQLPVFSIHGNHDDPSREGGGSSSAQQSLAALDLLSAANFVNYFGKSEKVDAIEVFPILMVKGETRVAIYGLGNMRDERLNRMFAQKKVVFRRPAENPEEWFSIFVVHQNRDDRGRGSKNCIPESFIPDFIDFVVWGHEHECLIDVQESVKGDFYITQPGSSVATSLVEGEAKQKQVAVLEIRGQNFRMIKRVLHTVRPFKMGEIILSEVEELDPNDPDVTDHIHELLDSRVRELLQEAEQELRLQPQTLPPELKQVLVRLRVEHTGFPMLHNQRFGSRFVGKVANPNDILLFYRRKKERTYALGQAGEAKAEKGTFMEPIRPTRLDTITIEDILQQKLNLPDQKLVFLPEKPLAIALESYVVKNIASALDEFVDHQLEETQRELGTKLHDAKSKQDIMDAVERKKEKVNAEHLLQEEEEQEHSATMRTSQQQQKTRDGSSDNSHRTSAYLRYENEDKDDDDDDVTAGSRGFRFGTPRSSATKASTSSRNSASVRSRDVLDDDDDDASDPGFMDSPKSKRKPAQAASRGRTPTATIPVAAAKVTRKPPARAASRKKATTRDLLSDEDDEDNDPLVDDDGDDDYEMGNDDDEDESERMPPQRVTKGKQAAASTRRVAVPKKRLRQQHSDDDDDDDFGDISPPHKRVAPAPKSRARATPAKRSTQRDTQGDKIDLCSSGEERAPAQKRKPQPKINEMFQWQQQSQMKLKSNGGDDDVESDAEFTQLAAAKAADTQGEFSQSQASQALDGGVRRRKLPLSMVAASQTSTQSGTLKRDTETMSAIRKGWGRSRR
ncbi:DNA repair protein, partial [Globisporangium splendens]